MALYFLTYDLRRKRDYQSLYDELKKFDAIKILESTWCFNRINTDARRLRDYFARLLDSDDGLMVSQVEAWASLNTDGSPEDLS